MRAGDRDHLHLAGVDVRLVGGQDVEQQIDLAAEQRGDRRGAAAERNVQQLGLGHVVELLRGEVADLAAAL